MFLQKRFQLSMQECKRVCLKYTVPKVGLFFGVKVPMLLDKNPLRIIKIPCPSSKQPDGRKTAPVTSRVRVSSCAAVILKELA